MLLILFLSYCTSDSIIPSFKNLIKRNQIIDPPVVVRVETKWDTIVKIVPVYTPKWEVRTEYKDTFIYRDIDTLSILKDYFATYAYFDILHNDSITIRIKDSITQNKIKSRSIEYDLRIPTTIITRDSIVRQRGFYIGLGVGGTTSSLNYVGAEALYKGKRKKAFGLGVGINQDFKLSLTGRFYWKLGK